MVGPCGKHFVAHWPVWLLAAAIVVVANELVDRKFFDHRAHLDGDFLLVVEALVITFFGSYFVAWACDSRSPA